MDRFFHYSYSKDTTHAVDAWSACETNNNTFGLQSAIELLENSRKFNIRVKFTPTTVVGGSGGDLVLVGYTENQGFECRIMNDKPFNYKLTEHGVSNDFTLGCWLTTDENSDENVGVFINTNYNGERIGTFKVQSKSYIDLSDRVQTLETYMRRLQQGLVGVQAQCPNPVGSNTCTATCPDTTNVVSGSCVVLNGPPGVPPAAVQNFAGSNNTWQCLWTGAGVSTGQAIAFCMPK
jgi:hypothetical protein